MLYGKYKLYVRNALTDLENGSISHAVPTPTMCARVQCTSRYAELFERVSADRCQGPGELPHLPHLPFDLHPESSPFTEPLIFRLPCYLQANHGRSQEADPGSDALQAQSRPHLSRNHAVIIRG